MQCLALPLKKKQAARSHLETHHMGSEAHKTVALTILKKKLTSKKKMEALEESQKRVILKYGIY